MKSTKKKVIVFVIFALLLLCVFFIFKFSHIDGKDTNVKNSASSKNIGEIENDELPIANNEENDGKSIKENNSKSDEKTILKKTQESNSDITLEDFEKNNNSKSNTDNNESINETAKLPFVPVE